MGMRMRATLTATLVVAVALGLAAAALMAGLNSSLEQSARAEAATRATLAAVTVAAGGEPALTIAEDTQVLDEANGVIAWVDSGDYTVEQSLVQTADGRFIVQGRASLAPAEHALATLRTLLIPGIPALLVLVALLTWASVGRALRPVSAIRAKVADITAHDLHERVPVPDARDEIGALARTVNATLDRLQTAVEAHKQFVADTAHELRSPLTILRTRLELSGDSAQALADVERLQALTTDLLLLARLDAGEPCRDEEVDLAQVVAEEAAQKRPRPEVKVTMALTPDLLVQGSSGQLRRLVASLVDNAVRHADTSVAVTLDAADDSAVLEVSDDGPGIPPHHRETVFDRFARLDHARTRDTGGSGPGLAIARDITTAHEGTLRLADQAKGTRMRAVLLLADG